MLFALCAATVTVALGPSAARGGDRGGEVSPSDKPAEKPGHARARDRRELLDSLARGRAFRSRGQSYELVGAHALGTGAATGSPSATRGAARSAPGSTSTQPEVVATKGPFSIVRDASPGPRAALSQSSAPTATDLLPVAVNTRTGELGVVLGTIVVRLRDPGFASAVASDHQLALSRAFPRLGLAFYRLPGPGDLFAASAALASDPRVLSSEIEVRERFHSLH